MNTIEGDAVQNVRFDEVAKILVGKRPRGPEMPETSTWEIRSRLRTVVVKLERRRIVEVGEPLRMFIGEPFATLTVAIHHNDGKLNLKMVAANGQPCRDLLD